MTTPSTSAQGPVAGWKLVPVEPTKAMMDAVDQAYEAFEKSADGAWCGAASVYRAMLAASPASPSPAASPASPSGVRVALQAIEQRADKMQPTIVLGDDESTELTPYQSGYQAGLRCAAKDIRASLASDATPAPTSGSEDGGEFQRRVQPWMMACFGAEISADVVERNHRFLEEALELVQSTGCTASEAHQLVDYVFGREIGETHQEIGGVMVTLAALCLALGEDMHAAGETELARIWTKVEKIRVKQAAKPKHSPLPQALAKPTPAPAPRCEYCDGTGDVHSIDGEWRGRCSCTAGASAPAGGDVRDRLRAAVLRGTADEVNGQPNGNIITKGCEAAEYCDPEDATGSFVDAVVDEVRAALSSSAGPAEPIGGTAQIALGHFQTTTERAQQITKLEAVIAGLNKQLTEQFDLTSKQAARLDELSRAHPAPATVEMLREAARDLIASRSSTYKAKNGRVMGIEDDAGEMMWIVPFDEMAALEAALAPATEGRKG